MDRGICPNSPCNWWDHHKSTASMQRTTSLTSAVSRQPSGKSPNSRPNSNCISETSRQSVTGTANHAANSKVPSRQPSQGSEATGWQIPSNIDRFYGPWGPPVLRDSCIRQKWLIGSTGMGPEPPHVAFRSELSNLRGFKRLQRRIGSPCT